MALLAGHRLMSTVVRDYPAYETISISEPREHVLQVQLERPGKSNAFNKAMWREVREAFGKVARDFECRAVVVTGSGRNFTGGLDLADASEIFDMPGADPARRALWLRELILRYQDSFSSIAACPQPVIAASHAACVGAGVDLITACDIRLASADCYFSVKEVDIGLAADVGTLQRLGKVVGNQSLVNEWCFTARNFDADEALRAGLLSRVLPDREATVKAAVEMAAHIASRSPVAVTGTKVNLQYSRDHTTSESLEFIAHWNMSMLQTGDIEEAVKATMTKKAGDFKPLAEPNVKRI